MKTVIEMAREVKMPYDFVTGELLYLEKLEAFANLVRADERKQIALDKKAEKRPQNCGTGYCSCIECVMEPAQQEPVATLFGSLPVYDTSPPAQRKPLTDEEISEIAINNPPMVHEFARAIEAKLKEKNT